MVTSSKSRKIRFIVGAASSLEPAANRGRVKRLADEILLIDDTYNANPKAMRAALETLALAHGRRRVACLADMLELGPDGPALHREVGAALAGRADLLLTAGPLAREIAAGSESLPPEARISFDDAAALATAVPRHLRARDAILVKGSRGMRMERVVDAIVAAFPGA